MQTAWESELAGYLNRLSKVQERTLEVLMRKRQAIVTSDPAAMEAASQEEELVVTSLQECVDQRRQLLEQAGAEGLPNENLCELSEALPRARRADLAEQAGQASQRARLLHHHSLVNWVVVQRTLLHLSQLLEIIATGGRLRPTYGKETRTPRTGSLVDRAV